MLDLCISIMESVDKCLVTESVADNMYSIILESTDIKSRIKILKNFNIKTPIRNELYDLCFKLEYCKRNCKNHINDEKTFSNVIKTSTCLIELLSEFICTGGIITQMLVPLTNISMSGQIVAFIISLIAEAISIMIIIINRKNLAYETILQSLKFIERLNKIIPKVKDKNEKEKLIKIQNLLNNSISNFALKNTKGDRLYIDVDSDDAKSFKETVDSIKVKIYEENASGNISDDERDLLLEMVVIK